MRAEQDRVDVGYGGSLLLDEGNVALLVPWLFGESRLSFATDKVAFGQASRIDHDEPIPPDIAEDASFPLASLHRGRRPVNLALYLADPTTIPPVRVAARLRVLGQLYHLARKKPLQGFLFSCPEPTLAVERLRAHGVEETTTPLHWFHARHRLRGDSAESSSGRPREM